MAPWYPRDPIANGDDNYDDDINNDDNVDVERRYNTSDERATSSRTKMQ